MGRASLVFRRSQTIVHSGLRETKYASRATLFPSRHELYASSSSLHTRRPLPLTLRQYDCYQAKSDGSLNVTVTVPGIRVLEYLDPQARSPFAAWFVGLNAVASAKVAAALYQLAAGNWSNLKGVGVGVFERKIDSGPAHRIYFGKDGEYLTILLGGSSKQRQQQAIETAKER